MTMENMDKLATQKTEIVAKIQQAMKDGDEEAFQQAFVGYTDILQKAVMAEAEGLVQSTDNQVLAGRGVRALTSEENKYYQKVIEAMGSSNPQQALSNLDVVMPKTILDAVFEDITEDHPLLDEIDFQNAGFLTEFIYSTQEGRHMATWGPVCSEIIKQLSAQMVKVDFSQSKLSAFIPVCKAMLDLGPAWIDRYVRTILFEGVANGLEYGIIDGAGSEVDEPVGMKKDLEGSITPDVGYPDKTAVAVTSFSPEEYGALVAQLATNRNGLNRPIRQVLLICNPVDYYSKVMPATTYLNPNGTYVNNVFPVPTKVVQSPFVDEGEAILGLGRRYFMAMGTGKAGKIEHSDEYRFLEDERVYLIKLYGTGRPKDNTSFILLNIGDLEPLLPQVHVANADEFPVADIPEG